MSCRKWITAVAVSIVGLTAARLAAQGEGPPAGGAPAEAGALFDQLDANDDGSLDSGEIVDEHRRLFDRLIRQADADKNGQLSREEFSAGLAQPKHGARRPGSGGPQRGEGPPPGGGPGGGPPDPAEAERRFGRLDANGDGQVSLDEVPEERREFFERMMQHVDTDNNDQISREEFIEGARAMAARFRGRGRPGAGPPGEGGGPSGDGPPGEGGGRGFGPPGGGPRGQRGHGGRPPVPPVEAALDADHDGTLSAAEIAAAPAALATLDADGDGQLEGEEFRPPAPPRGGPGGPGFGGPGGPPGPPGGGPPGSPAGGSPGADRGRDRVRAFLRELHEADADGDQRLSRDEAPERIRDRFDKIDSNGDEFIDMAEVRQVAERMAAGGKGKGKPGKGGAKRLKKKRPGAPDTPAETPVPAPLDAPGGSPPAAEGEANESGEV